MKSAISVNDEARGFAWTNALRLVVVASVLALVWGIIEHRLYRRSLQLNAGALSQLAMAWLLVAKVLILLTPGVVLGAVIGRLTHRIPGMILFVIYSTVVLSWLALDVRLHALYGNHLAHYLQFAMVPNAGDYAGGTGAIRIEVIWTVLVSAGATIGLLLASRLLSRLAGTRGRVLGLALAPYALALAVIPVQSGLGESRELQRLHEAMPVRMAWLSPFNRIVDRSRFVEPFAARFEPRLLDGGAFEPQPVDEDVKLSAPSLPNVVMVIVESWRFDAMARGWMPKLDALASARGLRLTNHSAGTHASHWGIFALLYGRPPVHYELTLSRKIPPQLCHTLRKSGYTSTFITSGSPASWSGMDRYIDGVFDRVKVQATGTWVYRDHATLRETRQIVRDAKQPQLVVAYLLSSHFPYLYPGEYGRHAPVADASETSPLSYTPADREGLLNRYANSMGFLDDKLASLVSAIDRRRNIIVIVGDHGESIWDDGNLSHFSKPSEMQTRTGCIIFPPSGDPKRIEKMTMHADVAPTIFQLIGGRELVVKHMYGRSVLADFVPDHVLVYTGEGHKSSGFQVSLLAPDGGLAVWMDRKRGRVEAIGRVDKTGTIDRFSFPPQAELDRWAGMLRADLARIADPTR